MQAKKTTNNLFTEMWPIETFEQNATEKDQELIDAIKETTFSNNSSDKKSCEQLKELHRKMPPNKDSLPYLVSAASYDSPPDSKMETAMCCMCIAEIYRSCRSKEECISTLKDITIGLQHTPSRQLAIQCKSELAALQQQDLDSIMEPIEKALKRGPSITIKPTALTM